MLFQSYSLHALKHVNTDKQGIVPEKEQLLKYNKITKMHLIDLQHFWV